MPSPNETPVTNTTKATMLAERTIIQPIIQPASFHVCGSSATEKHVSRIFDKLDLAPSHSDHRRVLAVLAYLRAAG
jgi:hypothetical protein